MMNEKPIERLNYYNGQRLEADDLRLEQEYHIRVRRWLNKSLYSAGIAHGLEVRMEKDKSQQVVISPGMALDNEGREIILLEEIRLPVVGRKSQKDGEVVGNYLTIQYREETRQEEGGTCNIRSKGYKKAGDKPAWGGPTRIRATPILGWSDVFPHESSGKIVLAQVELDQNCNIRHVHTYPRQNIGFAYARKIHQYALEGERHIDKDNPGRIYFHVRGADPAAVTLYLRADKFSTLYYSELGWHEHPNALSGNTKTSSASKVDYHTHEPGLDMKTKFDDEQNGSHSTHGVKAQISARMDSEPTGIDWFDILAGVITLGATIPFTAVKTIIDKLRGEKDYPPAGMPAPNNKFTPVKPYFALRVITRDETGNHPISSFADLEPNVGISINNGEHKHDIVGKTGSPQDMPTILHTHGLNTTLTIDKAGVDQANSEYKARSGPDEKALSYINNLQVYIGRVDENGVVPNPLPDNDNRTNAILTQLRRFSESTQSRTIWDTLGDGTSNHPVVEKGTGEIKLNFLTSSNNPLSFGSGQYYIDLRVESGGGRILYNLYVE